MFLCIGYDSTILTNSFSARWSGILRPTTQSSNNNTILTVSFDSDTAGARVYINQQIIIDGWKTKCNPCTYYIITYFNQMM
jgi:hypothetical protein